MFVILLAWGIPNCFCSIILKGSGPLSANLFVSVLSESVSDDVLLKGKTDF